MSEICASGAMSLDSYPSPGEDVSSFGSDVGALQVRVREGLLSIAFGRLRHHGVQTRPARHEVEALYLRHATLIRRARCRRQTPNRDHHLPSGCRVG
jgi:hypothetical protein